MIDPKEAEALIASLESLARCEHADLSIGDEAAAMIRALLAERDAAFVVLKSSYCVLAFAFNRIHQSSRSRDTELSYDIARVRARIENVIQPKRSPALENHDD